MASNMMDLFYGLFATAVSTVVAVSALAALAGTAIASHDAAVAERVEAAQQCTLHANTQVATRA